MPNSDLVALLYDAWADVDRAHADLTEEAAMRRFRGGSAFGWTYAHLAKQLDLMVNVRAQGADPDPVVGHVDFDFGGTGETPGWNEIRANALAVRERATAFLDGLSDEQLTEIEIPSRSRGRSVSLEYSLCRVTTHNWFHAGEVASKREMDGDPTGDYPGDWQAFSMRMESGSSAPLAVGGGKALVSLLLDTWDDAERAFNGLADKDATEPHFDGSPFGWTLAHFTGQMNMSATVLLGRGEQPPILEGPTVYEMKAMSVADWHAVKEAVAAVRQDVGDFLQALSPGDLAGMTVPATSRTQEVRLKYMLGRFIAHAYFHIGEVASKRDMLGHDAGDYPGALRHSLGR